MCKIMCRTGSVRAVADRGEENMATNLGIDEELLRQAVRLGKQRTKKATVNECSARVRPAAPAAQGSGSVRCGIVGPLLRLQGGAQETVIVLDTSVLSLAFRRLRQDDDVPEPVLSLRKWIIDDVPLAVPGIVLQELLSGVRRPEQFRKLQEAMAGFPVLLASETDHVRAAQIGNACRRHGVACSTIDALIAAQTVESAGRLFTTDADFQRIAIHSPLELVGSSQPP